MSKRKPLISAGEEEDNEEQDNQNTSTTVSQSSPFDAPSTSAVTRKLYDVSINQSKRAKYVSLFLSLYSFNSTGYLL